MIISKNKIKSIHSNNENNNAIEVLESNVNIEIKIPTANNEYFEQLADKTARLTAIRNSVLYELGSYSKLERELFFVYYGVLKQSTAKNIKAQSFLSYIDNDV